MAFTLSTGSTFSVAKTYGAAISVSAATNSTAAGFTATTTLTTSSAHSLSVGDYVEVTSGWGRLNNRIARCATGTTGNTVVLENIDTYDMSKYPTGSGGGSIRKITAWTALSQIKSLSPGGGDQQYADATALEDVTERKIPTKKSANTLDIELFDDPTLNWYADVSVASDSNKPYALMVAAANGSKTVSNAYWSLADTTQMAKDEVMTVKLSLSYVSKPTRYTS